MKNIRLKAIIKTVLQVIGIALLAAILIPILWLNAVIDMLEALNAGS